jgi:hypothetical protein
MKKISPMGLLNLFHKSAAADVNLTVHEHRLMSVIITYINGEDLSNGYKAWPSTDTLIRFTGLGTTTIENSRKKLVKDGWLTIISGKGKGSSNQYFVNGAKIVEAAAKSGVSYNDQEAAKDASIPAQKEPHKRNIEPARSAIGNPTVKVVEPTVAWFEDEPVKVVAKPAKVPVNPDGSNPYHRNGNRCHSYEDHENSTRNKVEVASDNPF